MFDELINLVKEHSGNAIINNTDVPNEKNDAVIHTTAGGIMDHLKNLAGSGSLQSITDLLKGGNLAGNKEVTEMSHNIAKSISEKFGIDLSKSEGIVKNLIPTVMGSLSKKTHDPNDNSFTMDGILKSLTGGSGSLGSIMDKVKNMF
ncbi:MAG: DUF937 domain-containing protein [Bacteroidota bacterium]